MRTKTNIIFGLLVPMLLLQISCKNKKTSVDTELLPKPQVQIVHPVLGEISENIQVNGQIVFLNKTEITAPISGYVTAVNTNLGNWVKKGSLLFYIQTKESKALQESNIKTMSDFGIIPVYASASGFVNTLNIADAGVFVSEGNVMMAIVKDSDLVIQVNLPYQYSSLINTTKNIEIELTTKETLEATFYKSMQYVDPVSQTQQVYFKLKDYKLLPENLNVIVKLPKEEKASVFMLPKEAVLTNETQNEFWLFKIENDSIAVKDMVIKGLENDDNVEIIAPALTLTDKIISKGAYGLEDNTTVKIN